MLATTGDNLDRFPINLASKVPLKNRFYECLIGGVAGRSNFLRILTLLESRRIAISACDLDSDSQSGTFQATLILELGKSEAGLLDLVERIMETKFVSRIEFSPLEGKQFSNFHFPIFLFPDKRGVILLAEELVAFENALSRELGSKARDIIFEEGRKYGSRLVSQIPVETVPTKAVLNASEILKATGWGICKFDFDESIVTLSLSDSPLNPKIETRGSFLDGMLQGITERILGHNLRILGVCFDPQKNSLNYSLSNYD